MSLPLLFLISFNLGTGNGQLSGIDNTAGGRCNNTKSTPEKTFKMILKLRVCTEDEENVYKNCTVCENVGCYTKGIKMIPASG